MSHAEESRREMVRDVLDVLRVSRDTKARDLMRSELGKLCTSVLFLLRRRVKMLSAGPA